MNKLLKVIQTKSIIVFIFFSFITLLLYFPTAKSGFVTDFTGWQKSYEQGSFKDIINCFGYNGLHQFLHLIFYSLFRFLGTDNPNWYVLFSLFHASIAYSIFKVFSIIFEDFKLKRANITALFAAVLFLVNPYQTEVLVWRVCVHYIIMAFCFVGSIWYLHQWLKVQSSKFKIQNI